MSRCGLRTLVIAQKELSQDEYATWEAAFHVRRGVGGEGRASAGLL